MKKPVLTFEKVEIPEEVREKVLKGARGKYQESLLSGHAPWSGKDLKGKAKRWGFVYSERRVHLFNRVQERVESVEGWSAGLSMLRFSPKERPAIRLWLRSPEGKVIDWVTNHQAHRGWVICKQMRVNVGQWNEVIMGPSTRPVFNWENIVKMARAQRHRDGIYREIKDYLAREVVWKSDESPMQLLGQGLTVEETKGET